MNRMMFERLAEMDGETRLLFLAKWFMTLLGVAMIGWALIFGLPPDPNH